MVEIEYLMIYQSSGLPIWSKCFGETCLMAAKQPELLSGFLTALEAQAEEVGGGVEAMKMGKTLMNFRKTTPSDHSIVIGTTTENEKLVQDLFIKIENILEDNYKDMNLHMIDIEEFAEEFEHQLYKDAIIKVLPDFHDECAKGDNCPMKTTLVATVQNEKATIWDSIRGTYQTIWKKMKKKINT